MCYADSSTLRKRMWTASRVIRFCFIDRRTCRSKTAFTIVWAEGNLHIVCYLVCFRRFRIPVGFASVFRMSVPRSSNRHVWQSGVEYGNMGAWSSVFALRRLTPQQHLTWTRMSIEEPFILMGFAFFQPVARMRSSSVLSSYTVTAWKWQYLTSFVFY